MIIYAFYIILNIFFDIWILYILLFRMINHFAAKQDMIFFYEFKRNIVLKLGLLYLLIHHYISLFFSLFEGNVALKLGILYFLIHRCISQLHFKKKCRLLHLHLWLGQSEEKISLALTFLVIKFNCLKYLLRFNFFDVQILLSA